MEELENGTTTAAASTESGDSSTSQATTAFESSTFADLGTANWDATTDLSDAFNFDLGDILGEDYDDEKRKWQIIASLSSILLLVLTIGLSTHCCVHFGCCGASNDAIKERGKEVEGEEERNGKKRRGSRRDEALSGDNGRRSSTMDKVRDKRHDIESM